MATVGHLENQQKDDFKSINAKRSAIGKHNRRVGKDYEREIANYFKAVGYDTHRTNQFCGNSGEAADVVGLPFIHIECKYRKSIGMIYDWIAQAVRDSKKGGKIPTVFARQAQGKTLVVMRLDDWFELYKAYEKEQEAAKIGNGSAEL